MAEFALPSWMGEVLKPLGSVAGFVALLLYYVPRDFLPRFVRSQEAQAVALGSLAESVKNLPQKDEMKFEAMLIGQELTHKELQRLHDRFDDFEGLMRNGHGA